MQKYKNIHKTALALFRHSPFCAYSPPKRPPPFYAFHAPQKTALPVGKFPTRKEYFAAVLRPLSRFSHAVDKTRFAVLRISRTSKDRLAGREIPNPQRILRLHFTNCSPPQKTTSPVWISPPRKKYFAAVLRPLSRFSHSVAKPHSDFFSYSVANPHSDFFLTPSIKPAPSFYAFFASKNSPKRETPRHLCHGHFPKPHSSLSAMRSLPHSPRFYTHFTPKSTPFHKVFRIRQNLLIFDTFNF